MWPQNRDSAVFILNEVLRSVKLDERLVRENNEILHDFLNSFLEEMKRVDRLFNNLYREPFYTGSFYSDLRISQPDEFDINLILSLPFHNHEIRITDSQQEPNFLKYQLITSGKNIDDLFEQGFLIPEKVRAWFQSVIDKALRTYAQRRAFRKVYVKEAGPARTITIVKHNGAEIDVDLVPVISCTLNMAVMNLDRRVEAKVGSRPETFLVPKPRYVDMREKSGAILLWRCHFPKSEENITYDVGCAKSVIKLLKLIRDKEQWSSLASYYLKTVVMWMIIDNSGTFGFWREDKIAERFSEALRKLARYVEQKNIPYIFNTSCNLIEKMSSQEAININNRLNTFIRNIYDMNYLRRMF